jgi:hypothetical protein
MYSAEFRSFVSRSPNMMRTLVTIGREARIANSAVLRDEAYRLSRGLWSKNLFAGYAI